MQNTSLVPYDPKQSLAEQTFKEVMRHEDVRDLYKLQNVANAARELAKQAREPKIHWNYFMAHAIWARWKIGKLIPTIINPKGGRPAENATTLVTLGIDAEHESPRWQLLARIDETTLGGHIAAYDGPEDKVATLTFNSCYKLLPKPDAPTGTYDVIVVDPPWEIKKIHALDRVERSDDSEDMSYAMMSYDELVEWGGDNLHPAPDCHFFLWTTHKYLPRSFDLLAEWGFKYICTFVWHKPGGFQPFGLPQYNCEFILYGHRGNPNFRDTKDFFTCFSAPRGAHSEKPEAFYQVIERVTEGKRLDMFSRRLISGFDSWGNEI